MRLLAFLLLLAGVGAVACSGQVNAQQKADAGPEPDSGGTCALGEKLACTCPDGTPSSATCGEHGLRGPCACGTPDAGPSKDHAVISTSSRSAIEAETSLAVALDGTLVSTWIAISMTGGSDIGYAFSKNGGETWTAPRFMGDPTGRESSDPVVTVDAQGNFYATWIAFHRNGQNATDFVLYVAKASAGGTAFATPMSVDTFNSGDKPWITVTSAGTILATYMVSTAGASTLYAQRSMDSGATWTRSTIATAPVGQQANFVVPCAGKTGSRVWAVNLSDDGSGMGQQLHWSDDDGVSWPDANSKLLAQNSSLEPAACVAKGSDVWIAYGQWTHNPQTQEDAVDEYHVAHTIDGVAIDDVRANDTATKMQNLGAISIEDATGEIALTYYAGDSEGDSAGSVRTVRSTDGGKTWGKSNAVGAALTFTSDRAGAQWLGDYLGTALQGGVLYVSYGENADNYTHIAFAKSP